MRTQSDCCEEIKHLEDLIATHKKCCQKYPDDHALKIATSQLIHIRDELLDELEYSIHTNKY